MSADSEATADELCASCGIAALDNVKLKKCACKLVKYCSVDCQKNHRSQHKKECKKRLAEIRDDNLFKQSEISCFGECPLCCLPMPIMEEKMILMACCSKFICKGCAIANILCEMKQGMEERCPFCREESPESLEESQKRLMKRVEVNDPLALCQMGLKLLGEGRNELSFQYLTKAAELGDTEAHYELSVLYREGKGVERDAKKELYHLEEAAIGGHPDARFNLGNHEHRNGRKSRAVKHWIIAAKLGEDDALQNVKKYFQMGYVSKEDLDVALRGHQAAVNAAKSEQRDAAEAFRHSWYETV